MAATSGLLGIVIMFYGFPQNIAQPNLQLRNIELRSAVVQVGFTFSISAQVLRLYIQMNTSKDLVFVILLNMLMALLDC